MDNRPIGIFDSGLGGLTGLKALQQFLPDENIVYFADSGRLPYGEKTREQLRGGRKAAFVVILILAALITPSDPFSMFVLSIPLYALYEFSILMCKPETPSDDDLN